MSNLASQITIIINSPPFSSISGKEGVDLALVCAAFEQKVNLVFDGDGILHLINNQRDKAINDKLHDMQLKALEFYDIDQVFVTKVSLKNRKLTENKLLSNCKAIEQTELKQLIDDSTQVVNF
ncbi:MAG: sulfurtransferase complex subunit TusC [Kangiellaceae bacterium]|nr:sulfurtransferase complex subunit TusC [Kangiellaceae bacterium]MCW9018128.1 sulfurtransferase complex subunit TusC [Kangiellaceae bacterium]